MRLGVKDRGFVSRLGLGFKVEVMEKGGVRVRVRVRDKVRIRGVRGRTRAQVRWRVRRGSQG